jgi:hypothetical protein
MKRIIATAGDGALVQKLEHVFLQHYFGGKDKGKVDHSADAHHLNKLALVLLYIKKMCERQSNNTNENVALF